MAVGLGVLVTSGVGVLVRVGRSVLVGGTSVDARVLVGAGGFVGAGLKKRTKSGRLKCLGVGLTTRVEVGDGLGVTDCVIVGVAEIKGVAVAVVVGVRVGSVTVGKGPSKASAVPMIAVLVASTPDNSCCSNPRALLLLKTTPYATPNKPIHSRHSTRTYM